MNRAPLLLVVLSLCHCDIQRTIGISGDAAATIPDGGEPPWTRIAAGSKNKVDILFMVDNSNSMAAMSEELKNRFSELFKVYQQIAAGGDYADLHIGVVTSDYGAGATGAPGCQASPGGQQGKLQAVGANAANTCKPPVGGNFVRFAFAANGIGPNNLPPGQDLVATFQCMASVGANGCGFEHQLESVYAALHNQLPENSGFLRDDALLTIVFLTNEDDSSAPPTTDMFDKNKTAQYGYEDSYRQTRFGVVCGPDPGMLTPYGDSMGPLSNCKAAPNPNDSGPGREYDLSRYLDFFTRPASQGGVKADPNDVILVAIDAPSEPVQIILSNPGTPGGMPYPICGALNELSNPPCVPVLQHACQNPATPVFFGDPAVRLNTVVNAVANHAIFSICDGDYTGAMQGAARVIIANASGAGCVGYALPDVSHPTCTVEDVTQNGDGSTTHVALAACPAALPCWSLVAKMLCASTSPQAVGITIQRSGAPPPNTTARFFCATP